MWLFEIAHVVFVNREDNTSCVLVNNSDDCIIMALRQTLFQFLYCSLSTCSIWSERQSRSFSAFGYIYLPDCKILCCHVVPFLLKLLPQHVLLKHVYGNPNERVERRNSYNSTESNKGNLLSSSCPQMPKGMRNVVIL